MLNVSTFKKDFRLVNTDTWGEAMCAWFDVATELTHRGVPIPKEWNYRSGLATAIEEDSYWYESFVNAKDQELIEIGNYLERFTRYLKHLGADY
jgi:hypothetical protein